jgi:hypothetical protein
MVISNQRGQSLIELMAGMAIGVIFIIGLGVVVAPSVRINQETAQIQSKAELISGLADTIKSWAGGNWNNVLALATGTSNLYYLSSASSPFVASAGSQQIIVGSTTYTQYFYVSDGYRDVSGNATTTVAGDTYDPSTKFFTATIAATTSPASVPLSLSFYLTRNASNVFSETSWAGGGGQNNPVTVAGTSFFSDSNITVNATGSITLSTTTSYGTLDSVTFDTGVTGSQLNSVLWQGSAPGISSVGFQIAVSNVATGPWNFKGVDGSPSGYFVGNPNTTINLLATSGGYSLFSGYRYFRYRLTLFPDAGASLSPTVKQAIVNWSP